MMKRKLLLIFLTFCVFTTSYCQEIQNPLVRNIKNSVVPYPKNVVFSAGEFKLGEHYKVNAERKLKPLADLLEDNIYTLFQIKGITSAKNADIILKTDKAMENETYSVIIDDNGITVTGKNYNAVCMGINSILQIGKVKDGKILFPNISFKDTPNVSYRGLMLDVARKPVDIETVKQCVEMCRWYKIRYLQMHLCDNQLFMFPSKAYPKLASKSAYTIDELKSLVAFAKKRGVIIIPEFDVPGHSSQMRKTMPKLFGEPNLLVVDMTKDEVRNAIKTIMKEMMDVFYTSPYFHIGADEVSLGILAKEKHVQDYIKARNFDNAHDIYLDFIVDMHEFVKKCGKKTLVWESFQNSGSAKVKIPKDIIVFAWETLYQRPESLLKNGYTIINASWKPLYNTPRRRWSPEYIYNWNIRRWENHWKVTPSYKHPIQLPDYAPVLGAQMCAWEMKDQEEISTLHSRIPAFSEVVWNGNKRSSYQDFTQRYKSTDSKLQTLLFPAKGTIIGFHSPDILYNLDQHYQNSFTNEGEITYNPLLPNTYITYTTDNSKPKSTSAKFNNIKLTNNKTIKYGIFDKSGKLIGYKSVDYYYMPFEIAYQGNMEQVRDRNIDCLKEVFKGRIMAKIISYTQGAEYYYTTDGKNPSLNGESTLKYIDGILIDQKTTLKIKCYINGNQVGCMFECVYEKIY